MPSVTKWNGAPGWASIQSVGRRWVSTTTGTFMVCSPSHPPVKSKSVRPQISTPISESQ